MAAHAIKVGTNTAPRSDATEPSGKTAPEAAPTRPGPAAAESLPRRADAAGLQSFLADQFATEREQARKELARRKAARDRLLREGGAEQTPRADPPVARPVPAGETVADIDAAPRPAPARQAPSKLRSRLTKSVLGLALVAIAGWMPAARLFEVSSTEAVVNARLVTMRAPIAGVVGTDVSVGAGVSDGQQLAVIRNPRADHQGVADATARLAQAEDERAVLVDKLAAQKAHGVALETRLATFRDNRLRLVAARIDEADARIASAGAVESRAKLQLERQQKLSKNGVLSDAVAQDAARDLEVARAAANEAAAARAALVVEADALRAGSYFGDDYNDAPRSAQALDDANQAIAALEAEIAGQDRRIADARAALEREQDMFRLASQASVTAPAAGRVWEILAAPGEQVVAGQELATVLDCARMLVTATVSEAVYNTLRPGMSASFALRETGRKLPGKVVQLSGIAAASSNFAILPSALIKDPYRVAVEVYGLSADGSCPVGQTGRVVFNGAK